MSNISKGICTIRSMSDKWYSLSLYSLNFLIGFTHGLSGLMLSVLSAVAGVADQPLQELFRANSVRDVTSGLIPAVGKGLIGVVTKPLGGAMELVSRTGEGILQGTGLGEMPTRLYEAQDTGDAIKSSSNLKYIW